MQVKCPKCSHTFFTERPSYAPISILPLTTPLSGRLMEESDWPPVCCIDCGVVISRMKHYRENGIEGWGYKDTVERIDSADSLRCGKCYRKHARLE
jgi:hypothetical protein